MIQKVSDIFARKKRVFSFEIYPPKTPQALAQLYRTVEELAKLEPDYVSVTYGAGGSTGKATLEIIGELQGRLGLTCVHHLTLVGQTRSELAAIIGRIRDAGVRNILALRGDPPVEMGGAFRKVEGGLEYCYELIDLIRQIAGDYFCIGVAGFPDGHIQCRSKDLDSRYLKIKVDHGGEFVVTQIFFDNRVYSQYLERLGAVRVRSPVMPGVLPITDYSKLLKFCDTCGAYICREIHEIFGPIRQDLEATAKRGAEYVLEQGRDLLRRGAPGIHFYCLNKVEPVRTVWKALKEMPPV